MKMKRLGKRNYNLISRGVKTLGTYNPEEIFPIFEEDLYTDEVDIIHSFLEWVHKNQKTFGSGNYEQIFQEFLKSPKGKKTKKIEIPDIKDVHPVFLN